MGLNLAGFGKKVSDVLGAVGNTAIPGLGSYNIGNAYNDLIQKPIVNPVLQGGQQLTNLSNATNPNPAVRAQANPVDFQSLLGNAAVTGLNAATLGHGGSLLTSGSSLLKNIGTGALEQGSLGAATAGASSIANHQSLPETLKNTAEGGAFGAVGGAVLPAIGAGARVAFKGAKTALQNAPTILADESGYIGQPRINGKFGEGLQTAPAVDVSNPKSVFDRMVGIKQELQGNPAAGAHGLEAQYQVEKQLADNPLLSKHDRLKRNETLENSSLVSHMRDLYQQQEELQPHFDRHFTAQGKPTLKQKLIAPLKSEGGYIGLPGGKSNSDRAAEFLGVNPEVPTSVEKFNATNEPLTVEKVAKASARAKQIDEQTIQSAIDRATTAENNPVKVNLSKVNPGDHAQAIVNSQQISKPVGTAQQLWENSMQRLKKQSPQEFKDFWKAVEDPTNAAHSPAMQQAISAWRAGADRAHAGATALGRGVGYIENYARHPWDLSGWKEVGTGEGDVFTKAERKHQTIAAGEAAGLKQKGDPLAEGRSYFRAAQSQLRKDALVKGLEEADAGATVKPHTLDLGYGKTVPLSAEGMRSVRGLHQNIPTGNPVVKSVRTVNAGIKSTILSLGQFHTINIGALRAAPTLIATGHPAAAAKGLYRMFRGAFGSSYADRVIGGALKDGTVEKAAQIGMPYGGGGYSTEGTFLKHGIGSRTVFGKQIPMMHDQVARSILSDLESKGIPLDSPQARVAGLAGAHLMGEMNKELENISPRVQRAMSDWMLASEFTPSKFKQIGTAINPKSYTKGGVAGKYASASVLSNVAAVAATAAGLGALAHQESDNIKDILLRALVDPAAPTSSTDTKGNTVKLKLPGTDTSDVAHLLGISLVREDDGHLGINWSPQNIPTTVSEFLRARLSPLASAAVKLGTNTTFAGKPLYDPNASTGTQAQQAATSLAVGSLPIGLQGIAYTDAVKNNVPEGVKQVLDAQTPGSNPVLKSIGSSFGVTPATDTTVGKGQETTRYFGELAKAKQGLNRQAADVLDLYSGSKKNPVTGKYDVQPNVNDQRARATTLLQNPEVIDRLVTMNTNLASEGQKVDPLWRASKEQITKYLQYQAMRPNGPDQKNWRANNPWYQPLQAVRSEFFSSLPAGDPNKPKAPIEYPQASPEVSALQSQFFSLPDGRSKAQFIDAHPALQQQFDAQFKYYNDLSSAQGYTPIKGYPVATPEIKAKLNAKDYKDPQVQAYLNQTSEYNIIQGGANAQFEGTNLSQAALKGVKSLGQYGLVQNPDGSLAVAGSAQALPGAVSQNKQSYHSSRKIHIRRSSSGGSKGKVSSGSSKKFKVSLKKNTSKSLASQTYKSGQPKVSIKSSNV